VLRRISNLWGFFGVSCCCEHSNMYPTQSIAD
jgi:hypothetical protein